MKLLCTAILGCLFLIGCGVRSTPQPLQISTSSLPTATKGVLYSEQLVATGGTAPYTWTIASGTLPAGIELSSTGELLGVPTSTGLYTFVVDVTDSSQVVAQLAVRIGGGKT